METEFWFFQMMEKADKEIDKYLILISSDCDGFQSVMYFCYYF